MTNFPVTPSFARTRANFLCRHNFASRTRSAPLGSGSAATEHSRSSFLAQRLPKQQTPYPFPRQCGDGSRGPSSTCAGEYSCSGTNRPRRSRSNVWDPFGAEKSEAYSTCVMPCAAIIFLSAPRFRNWQNASARAGPSKRCSSIGCTGELYSRKPVAKATRPERRSAEDAAIETV